MLRNFKRLFGAKVQSPAPHFSAPAVVSGEFKQVSLKDYSAEIISFSERSSEFAALNTQVLGCSVDSKFSHLAWINQPRKQGGLGEMKIPLISDITKTISRDYGVLLDSGIALRGTFIIDPKGIVRQSTINDLPIGRNIDETLRLVEALQFNEKYGEVCPIGWKSGSPTMKDNPKESKEYFAKHGK